MVWGFALHLHARRSDGHAGNRKTSGLRPPMEEPLHGRGRDVSFDHKPRNLGGMARCKLRRNTKPRFYAAEVCGFDHLNWEPGCADVVSPARTAPAGRVLGDDHLGQGLTRRARSVSKDWGNGECANDTAPS